MDNKILNLFFDLIKSSLTNTNFSKNDACFTDADILQLFTLAKKHDLSHLIADSIYKNSVIPYEEFCKKKLYAYQYNAVYRSEKRKYAYDLLCNLLENAKIVFVPLKGIVVNEFYAQPWMRTSGDIDILINEKDIPAAIQLLSDNGWTLEEKPVYKDYLFHFKNGISLELHFSIRETFDTLDKVLDRVWEHIKVCDESEYKMLQTNEFLMFHLLAHMAYHFMGGGCGIRSFIDIWVLRNKLQFDEKILRDLCKQAKIEEFYDNVLDLINVWFNGENQTELTNKMQTYILNGGIFGELSNRVAIQQIITGSRFKNIINRIFMPYKSLVIKYPYLKGKSFLTPFFQVRRWIETIKKGRFNKSVNELKTNTDISVETVDKLSELLVDVGLYNIIQH